MLPTIFLSLAIANVLNAQEQTGGYLATVFKGNVPHVFFNVAPKTSPSTFAPINGGKAVLIPTKGTRGARDPFVIKSHNSTEVSIKWAIL